MAPRKPMANNDNPVDDIFDFVFAPFRGLSDIVNQNAPIKKGGQYVVPQDMTKGRTKRQNPVTAHPKARPGKAAGAAIGNMAKTYKPSKNMMER
jgi:hypothetical protein